jgi:hypothetical protein
MKRLRERLDELHKELEQTDSVDAEARQSLGRVLEEIQALLERPEGEAPESHLSLSERLAEATQNFEESHPRLAEALGRVVDALANLGI